MIVLSNGENAHAHVSPSLGLGPPGKAVAISWMLKKTTGICPDH